MATRSVQSLVDGLGPSLVVSVHGDLTAEVTSVILTDPAFPVAQETGSLVLAAGFTATSPAFLDLCEQAAASGVAAVVVKGDHPVVDPRVAVVVVQPAAEWTQLASLARAATAWRSPSTGSSLFDLADAIAGLCGGPVVLHDSDWELLAYSGDQPKDGMRSQSILRRRAPSEAISGLRARGLMDTILRGGVVHVADGDIVGMSERYAAGVVIGGQFLGSLWLLAPANDTDQDTPALLRRAADMAGLSFLQHETSQAHHQAERDAALEALLTGGRTERLVADRLTVDPGSTFVLAGLRSVDDGAADSLSSSRRLLGMTRSYLEAYRVPAVLTVIDGTLYLLFPHPDQSSRVHALKVLTDLQSRLQRSVPHRAMISSPFQGLISAAATRTVVDELLELAQRRGWNGLTDSEAVQATWRLEQFREVALAHPSLLQGPVVRLVEHDRENGSDLVETLRVWFECVADTRATASRLNLHVNTVRYRLKKVEEVAALRLDNQDERLLMELQVRLLVG